MVKKVRIIFEVLRELLLVMLELCIMECQHWNGLISRVIFMLCHTH